MDEPAIHKRAEHQSAFQQHLNSRRSRLLDFKAGLLALRHFPLCLPVSFGAETVAVTKKQIELQLRVQLRFLTGFPFHPDSGQGTFKI